jgi:hypothetical protein
MKIIDEWKKVDKKPGMENQKMAYFRKMMNFQKKKNWRKKSSPENNKK